VSAVPDPGDLIHYNEATVDWIVAEIRGFVQAARLHLGDMNVRYTQLLANGWKDTTAAIEFGGLHQQCMQNADDLETMLNNLGIQVDAAKLAFFAADRTLAGELLGG
jgi:uncharacterized protein YukE